MPAPTRLVVALLAAGVLVACGGSDGTTDAADDTSSSPASPSVSATTPDTGHDSEAGEPELIEIAGYEYSDEVGPVGNVCKMFTQEVIATCSVHKVTNLSQGFFIVMGFNPDLPLQGDVASNMLQGMAATGGKVTSEKVAGETVALAQAAGGVIVAGWEHDGVMYMAQSNDGDALEDFVTQYVTVQNA